MILKNGTGRDGYYNSLLMTLQFNVSCLQPGQRLMHFQLSTLSIIGLIISQCLFPAKWTSHAAQRPNILWLSAEDISAHIGCYGDPNAITPNIDKLASEGVRFTRAFTTAGVCAPCRSGIITGMYQTTLGTHHMRCTATLPDHIKPFPYYLRQNGYFCTNNSKQDYQFKAPKETWDHSSNDAHWRMRPQKDQPFFSVFNFGGCHESGIANESKYKSVTEKLNPSERQDPGKLALPPYFPDTPIVREDWKRNYELITAMDQWAADLIDQLKEDGLYESTIIVFWSDHGVGLPRSKRWLYNSGTHIPLVVRIPEAFRSGGQGSPGTVSNTLVSSIDFGPTMLNLAGIPIPGHVQGQPFLGNNLPESRKYVFGCRDRMDERYDIIRTVRDDRFLYVRNYEPLKTYYQYMNTPEKGATMKELRRLHDAGELPPEAEKFFSPKKPVEELYDYRDDPHNLRNLASDPNHANTLKTMRETHQTWTLQSKDLGLIPEPIIAERVRSLGSEYDILRQKDADAYNQQLSSSAIAASSGLSSLNELLNALKHKDSAIRYWGATGIGNIGKPALTNAEAPITASLKDDSSAVRTAAARALCRMGKPDTALPVLIHEMTTGTQWERLHAAIVLDEIDELAEPVAEEMKEGLNYQEGFNSKGKYRVRVINRALNELHGTNNTVQ